MRFEQKHQFFKKVARACNNFVNILKTLSVKCQLLFAYESKGIRFPENVLNLSKLVDISSCSFSPSVAAAIASQDFGVEVKATKQVCVDGLTYKQGSLLLLGSIPSSQDVNVGWIEAILLHSSSVSFVLRNQVSKFNPQVGIYHTDMSGGKLNHYEISFCCVYFNVLIALSFS